MDQSLEREIRRLYSCFHSPEDRQGRSFVPLADAYRRAGDLLRARLLLEEGLRRHPGFSSAHVVAMRIARDVSDHAGALAATRRVLELDPDNVEAQQVLARVGPLARDAGSPAEAGSKGRADAEVPDESWMVGDAGVWTAGTDSGLASVDPVALKAEEEQAAAGEAEEAQAAVAEAEEEPAPTAEAEEEPPAAVEAEEEHAAVAEAEVEQVAAVEAEPEQALVPAAEAEEGSLAAAEAEEEPPALVEVEAEQAAVTEAVEEHAAAAELEEAQATVLEAEAEPLASAEAEEEHAAVAEAEEEPPVAVEARATTEEPAAPATTEGAGSGAPPTGIPIATPTDASDAVEATGIYTRTMGQLYERQGLHAQAIAVYERLIESEPDDEALAGRLERLRGQARDEGFRSASAAPGPGGDSPGIESTGTRALVDDERPTVGGDRNVIATEAVEPDPGGERAKAADVVPVPGDGPGVVPIEALAPDAPIAEAHEEAP